MEDFNNFIMEMISCSENNYLSESKAEFVCQNKYCFKNGLVCRKQSCQCIKKHKKCELRSLFTLIQSIDTKRTQRPIQIQKTAQILIKHYDDLIQMISIQKEYFQKWYDNYGLQLKQIIFLDNLNEISDKINGKAVSQLKELPKFQTFNLQQSRVQKKSNAVKNLLKEALQYLSDCYNAPIKKLNNIQYQNQKRLNIQSQLNVLTQKIQSKKIYVRPVQDQQQEIDIFQCPCFFE